MAPEYLRFLLGLTFGLGLFLGAILWMLLNVLGSSRGLSRFPSAVPVTPASRLYNRNATVGDASEGDIESGLLNAGPSNGYDTFASTRSGKYVRWTGNLDSRNTYTEQQGPHNISTNSQNNRHVPSVVETVDAGPSNIQPPGPCNIQSNSYVQGSHGHVHFADQLRASSLPISDTSTVVNTPPSTQEKARVFFASSGGGSASTKRTSNFPDRRSFFARRPSPFPVSFSPWSRRESGGSNTSNRSSAAESNNNIDDHSDQASDGDDCPQNAPSTPANTPLPPITHAEASLGSRYRHVLRFYIPPPNRPQFSDPANPYASPPSRGPPSPPDPNKAAYLFAHLRIDNPLCQHFHDILGGVGGVQNFRVYLDGKERRDGEELPQGFHEDMKPVNTPAQARAERMEVQGEELGDDGYTEKRVEGKVMVAHIHSTPSRKKPGFEFGNVMAENGEMDIDKAVYGGMDMGSLDKDMKSTAGFYAQTDAHSYTQSQSNSQGHPYFQTHARSQSSTQFPAGWQMAMVLHSSARSPAGPPPPSPARSPVRSPSQGFVRSQAPSPEDLYDASPVSWHTGTWDFDRPKEYGIQSA